MKDKSENTAGPDADSKLDRTHELTWALLDEQISDAEMSELDLLLRTEGTARDSYIRCMQLHAELASHFAPPAKSSPSSTTIATPILGFLNMETPFTGVDSPTADGAH
jgi:hypothetical protein